MTQRTKADLTTTRIRKAVVDHALGKAQRSKVVGPLEVTPDGLVLHVGTDFAPLAPTRVKDK
jgi:hypothetical protein